MTYKPGTVILHSRRYVDLFHLQPEEIDILDIAHALSMKCRYGGHSHRFYSVAEHSVLVSNYLSSESLITQLAGLLHDAAEAYVPDLLGPIRKHRAFREIAALEDEIDGLIVEKYIEPFEPHSYNIGWTAVKHADMELLRSECISLWGCRPEDWGLTVPKVYTPVLCLRPHDAALMFEDRYRHLVMALETERDQRKEEG